MSDRYDTSRSYQWNFEHPPEVSEPMVTEIPGTWRFVGREVPSPLGIAAGPLLNGQWCLYYAALGFDVLTYKTVRSRERVCYPAPNLLSVETANLQGGELDLAASQEFHGSWAISFGMPSKSPKFWMQDIAETRRKLDPRKKLSVSVVGSVQPDWLLEQLAEDYAECALRAKQSGADVVEINLSCPNVTSCDGQLYQNPEQAKLIARTTRKAIGDLPLIIKIGHDLTDNLFRLVDALVEEVDAIATVNCLVATVKDAFEGQPRGIGGHAILDASVHQVERLANYIATQNYEMKLIGVGGVSSAADVKRYLSAGAESTHLATAAMQDPEIALTIKRDWARS